MNKRNPDWQEIIKQLLTTYTQTELSEKLGVVQQQISSLKNGHRGKRISYTLGYDILELYSKTKFKA